MAAGPPAAASPRYLGRPLPEVLAELQRSGLALVYTSERVLPGMRVLAEPPPGAARRILDAVLAPHGLTVEEGPGGVLVVVAAPGTIRGEVVVARSRAALPGAVVRVVGGPATGAAGAVGWEAPAGSDGRFTLGGLPPGDYVLEAAAPGHLPQRLDRVAVAPGTVREVIVSLSPRPFLDDEIVVRPSRLSLLVERPEATLSLSRSEITALPHLGGDVLRAASLFPGTAANDVTARFRVHGGRGDEVMVMLDGQELYHAFHLRDYDDALSLVPGVSLAGADLSTGTFPADQGDRMSGVLDLRTVDPRSAAGGRRLLLDLGVLSAVAAGWGPLPGARGTWLVTARRGALDLAGDVIGDGAPVFWDVFAKGSSGDTAAGTFTGHVLTAGDELELASADEEGFEQLENDYRTTYSWLTHQLVPRGRLAIQTHLSWTDSRHDRNGAGREEEGGHVLDDRRLLRVAGAAQSFGLELPGRHLARWGWEARRYVAEYDYRLQRDPEIEVFVPHAAPRPEHVELDTRLTGEHFGAWTSNRLARGRLTAELGLRYDRHTATDESLWSPRANFAWRLGASSVLRAAWGRFVQSHRPHELQVEDGETRLAAAESADHWVLGYETLRPPGGALEGLRLEVYRRTVDDPRQRYENLLEPLNVFPEIEPDRVRIAPSSSTARGVELMVRGAAGPRGAWWAAYSWAEAEDRLAGGPGAGTATVPRALDQTHTVNASLSLRLPRRWNLTLAGRYHSGWPTTPVVAVRRADPDDPEAEPELVPVFGELRSRRLPDYHRLDLRVSRGWELRTGRLTFYADVQNLYDRENLAGFDIEIDDEAEAVVLEPEHWPGIFPSLGVLWEF